MAEADPRPLSPHLQVYRWTITMASSILHRATGAGLGLGMVVLVWWLIAAASGPEAFAQVQACLASIAGRLVLFGITWSLMFHLLNGIRHLAWDIGLGFGLKAATATGWATALGSVILTLGLWWAGYQCLGAGL